MYFKQPSIIYFNHKLITKPKYSISDHNLDHKFNFIIEITNEEQGKTNTQKEKKIFNFLITGDSTGCPVGVN